MHPDEVAFLEAIRAGEETARLVFADWLEERGDPRGPWVRDPDIWPFMAPDATDPVPRLLTVAHGKIPDRNKAILSRLGPAAVPALVKALPDVDWRVHEAALEALGKIGPAAAVAVPALVKTLRDKYGSGRATVAKVLGQIGPSATKAVPALREALREKDQWVRQHVVRALGQIGAISEIIIAYRKYDGLRKSMPNMFGNPGPAAIPGLIQTLWCEDPNVIRQAARALGWIGPAAAEAVPALVDAVRNDDLDVHDEVAEALRQIGPAAAEAIPALMNALQDKDPTVRHYAVLALEKIEPGVVVPALTARLDDPDDSVRDLVREVLERIGGTG